MKESKFKVSSAPHSPTLGPIASLTNAKRFKMWPIVAALTIATGVSVAALWAAPSTEQVISLPNGLHITDAATDRVGFHGVTPVAKPSAAAQATVVPVASATVAPSATATVVPVASATVSPTAIPTITPTFTPVGATLDVAIAQINLLTAKVNQLVADNVANTAKVNSLIITADTNTAKINQLVADNVADITLTNRLQLDLKNQGLIKGSN